MGKNNDDDALEKLREWQEHQYNPGYWAHWANRRLRYGKNTKSGWYFAIFLAFFLTVIFLGVLWLYLSYDKANLIGFLLILGLSALFIYGMLAISRPDKEDIPNEEESSNLIKKQKKKIPKRRKDYH